MSKRSDILEDPFNAKLSSQSSGLIYTEELGWIDLGHARGADIVDLLHKFRTGESGSKDTYRIRYNQMMFIGHRSIGTGRFVEWEIKRGRTNSEIESIALAMMMHTSYNFEYWQTHFSWFTDSGYSAEDLISNLLGFYYAISSQNYLFNLKAVSQEAAFRRWDYYGTLGQHKNKSFFPLLFPDPQIPGIKHQPYFGKLPVWMQRIIPFTDVQSSIAYPVNKNGMSLSFFAEKHVKV
ncbi:DUF4056 domain-containing protein [Brenneria goodwinii]|uniref:DUF4056 domain-containing protein n=1 Tax=Brenneria goodwinii TaxID=1109412 RepID=UPI0036EB01FE